MVTRRVIQPLRPVEVALSEGLAYSLWSPAEEARAGVVVLHGADSCKESHFDFCRALVGAGLAALAFDARGHGESQGGLDARAVSDVAAMARLLRDRLGAAARIALRGSSMGGYLAIAAATEARADAVVAICPATGEDLQRGLAAGRFGFRADVPALSLTIASHDLFAAAAELEVPLLILHAEGDEVVPVQGSRELAGLARCAGSRLIVVPGGHHRSVQHDEELQAVSLRWLARVLG